MARQFGRDQTPFVAAARSKVVGLEFNDRMEVALRPRTQKRAIELAIEFFPKLAHSRYRDRIEFTTTELVGFGGQTVVLTDRVWDVAIREVSKVRIRVKGFDEGKRVKNEVFDVDSMDTDSAEEEDEEVTVAKISRKSESEESGTARRAKHRIRHPTVHILDPSSSSEPEPMPSSSRKREKNDVNKSIRSIRNSARPGRSAQEQKKIRINGQLASSRVSVPAFRFNPVVQLNQTLPSTSHQSRKNTLLKRRFLSVSTELEEELDSSEDDEEEWTPTGPITKRSLQGGSSKSKSKSKLQILQKRSRTAFEVGPRDYPTAQLDAALEQVGVDPQDLMRYINEFLCKHFGSNALVRVSRALEHRQREIGLVRQFMNKMQKDVRLRKDLALLENVKIRGDHLAAEAMLFILFVRRADCIRYKSRAKQM